MSGIITQGYGKHSLIITCGFGSWKKVLEVIEEIRSKIIFIPKEKRKFKERFKVYGDLATKFYETIEVKGKKALPMELLMILIEDEGEDLTELVNNPKKELVERLKKLVEQMRRDLEDDNT